MAGDGASNAANKFKPSEEQLSQIDRPADDNTWHDVPDLSATNIKGQMKDQYEKVRPPKKESDSAAVETPVQDGTDGAKGEKSIADSTKSKGRETMERSKEYLEKKMPKERREQTIWRLKKMIVEVQGHQDCKQHQCCPSPGASFDC